MREVWFNERLLRATLRRQSELRDAYEAPLSHPAHPRPVTMVIWERETGMRRCAICAAAHLVTTRVREPVLEADDRAICFRCLLDHDAELGSVELARWGRAVETADLDFAELAWVADHLDGEDPARAQAWRWQVAALQRGVRRCKELNLGNPDVWKARAAENGAPPTDQAGRPARVHELLGGPDDAFDRPARQPPGRLRRRWAGVRSWWSVGTSERRFRAEPDEPADPLSELAIGHDPGDAQLAAVVATASAMLDEETRRSERLEARLRNVVTLTAAAFAVVQAAVIILVDGTVTSNHHRPWSVVGPLVILGGLAALTLIGAITEAYSARKLRDDPVIEVDALTGFLPFAHDDDPEAGVRLVEAYAEVIEGRRANNVKRACALRWAYRWSLVAVVLIAAELVLALVAAA